MDDRHRPKSLSMQEILGRPLNALAWSPLFHCALGDIDRMPDCVPKVYLIHYQDNPKKLKATSMVYVGRADRFLKCSLSDRYVGKEKDIATIAVFSLRGRIAVNLVGSTPTKLTNWLCGCIEPLSVSFGACNSWLLGLSVYGTWIQN